jgi:hypothetical protein
MFEDVKKRYPDVKYTLTSRVNQDVLENFFSSLRGRYTKSKTYATAKRMRY